jgi:hypothetical protein
MIREDGSVKVNGKIAYAPQNAWYAEILLLVNCCSCSFARRIMNATIRENILFSHRYDEEFYNLVLDGVFFSRFLPTY